MEEAVSELIRYSKRDRSIIGGKPRTLIDRMFEFFRRMASAVKGTGYNTLNDLLDNIESGGLGARERGVVRTARATERLMGAIPARGIGRDIDMVELPVINESGATADINAVTDNISASLIRDYKPKKTVRAYKLFTKGEDGKLYPLFVDADAEVPVGEWMQANFPEYKFTAANGRVYVPSRGTGGAKGTGDNIAIPDQATRDMLIKAGFLPEGSTAKTITAVAARPGWHAGDSPSAKHIGGEPTIDGVKYKVRKPNQVWAEVEMPADTDWQSEAEATAGRTADGKLKVKEADINDRLPSNGYYRYKTNPNMEGNWLISGEMKVVRELSRDEVKEINKRNGTEDLPTESELMAMSEKERSKYQRKGKPKYVGAPKGLDSGQALGRMRKVIDSLAKEGEGGRFWYERSGRALLEITGGDREKAKRLAQAIAITSPQTPVPTNFSYAMQAYYQHEAGEPIVTGMYPKSMSQKLQDVFDGKDWEGRKTNNFYTNVMREIDPTLDQGVTTDLWMMRAFGYDTDAPTDAQYTFAENETARLAEKLGWEPQQVQAAIWVAIKGRMEAPEVKKRTEERSIKKGYMHYEKNKDGKNVRVIDNESKHRGIWIEEALKYNPTGADKEKAKFDFEDARDNNLAQISWESIPGATADHMPEIFGAEYPVIQQYHVDISKAFLDEDGNDLVAKELGVLSPGDFEAPGYFEGRVSPGTQTQVVSPKRYKAVDISKIDKQLKEGKITKEQAEELMGERLDPQSEDAIAAYAAARGILMKQDGVGYHRPFYDKSMRKLDLNGAEINIGRPFTEKETADFAQIMADISGHGEFNPIASPNGARLINFDYLMPDGQSYTNQKERGEFNQNFNNMVVKGLARMQFENGESVQLDRFYAKAGYLGNNWEENKNGEGYYADIAARSPDLSRRVYDIVRKIQPRIEAIDQEYASKFGWTINDSINRVFRRPDPATGRADQADYEATVRGAVRPNGNLALTHYGNKKINVTNPLLSGTGADRFKRNKAPNAIWYGITDAEVSPYVRESMIPQVENKFEIPLDELYVIADRDNANVPVDPLNVFTKNLRGDVDYESILDKVTDNGYTGFIINAPAYGKVAVIRKPLKAIPEDASIEIDNQGDLNDIVESRRRVDNILSQEPQGSMARIYNEEVMRPILEEQQMRGTPFSWQAKSYSTGDKIIYQAADKLIGLKNAEEQINAARRAAGLPPIANKDSAYVGEESIPGKIGIEIKDFQENIQRPLARKIANNNLTIEEVDEFLTFRHAIERNNRIALRDQSRNVETNPGSGSLKTGDRLSNSFVKATMRRKYGLEWNDATESWEGGNERARKLLDVASDIDKITRQTTDRLVSGGLLSRENGEALKRLYKYYAPLKGKAQEDDLADLVAVSSGLSTKGKEYMRAFGRESAAESPLGHIMLNAERAISRAVKNQSFGERLVNLIKENPNEDFWEVYSEDNPRFKMAFDKYYTYIGSDPAMSGQRFKEIPQGMSSRDFVQYSTFNKDGLLKLDNDLIGAKIGGKEYFINIKDDRLRRAIQSVNAGEAANALRKFSMVNRWLSMMNTSLNPEFVIGNFSRDLQTAIYNVIGEQTMTGGKIKDQKRIVRRILKDVIPSMGAVYKGMRRYDLKDGTLRGSTGMSQQDYNDFREFMESGAKADWFYNRPAEEQAQTIENMINMERGTFSGNFRRRYENVRDFVEDANASVENAVRFAAFKAARDELLDSGVSRDEAVATASTLAKNLTVNFNRKGMQGDLLNSLFLFYNASVQGTLNFARGLNVFDPGSSRMKQGMVASMIGFGALMALKAEEESEENPDTGRSYYSEIPDYVKERNIVIMKENGKDYYTIPLPYGYNVFHVAGSKLYEMKSDLISPVKAASDLTSAFMGSFSPIGFFPLPTVTQPFWEIAKNENYFGSPIYKENFPTGTQVPASQLAMSTTRTPFKVAAKILNGLTGGNEYESGYIDVSPDALEHIAEFAFGGAGTFGLRNMNALEKWAKGEELETREMPFIRRIMGEPNEQMSMSDYYDRKVKLEQKEAALEGYRGAERLQYRNRNKDYITMFNLLDQSERQLRQLRKARSEIRTAAALSPANAKAYAEREEQIEGAIQKIYDRFNKYYDERVGRTK
jgi:hypothetical protein